MSHHSKAEVNKLIEATSRMSAIDKSGEPEKYLNILGSINSPVNEVNNSVSGANSLVSGANSSVNGVNNSVNGVNNFEPYSAKLSHDDASNYFAFLPNFTIKFHELNIKPDILALTREFNFFYDWCHKTNDAVFNVENSDEFTFFVHMSSIISGKEELDSVQCFKYLPLLTKYQSVGIAKYIKANFSRDLLASRTIEQLLDNLHKYHLTKEQYTMDDYIMAVCKEAWRVITISIQTLTDAQLDLVFAHDLWMNLGFLLIILKFMTYDNGSDKVVSFFSRLIGLGNPEILMKYFEVFSTFKFTTALSEQEFKNIEHNQLKIINFFLEKGDKFSPENKLKLVTYFARRIAELNY